MEKGQPIYIWVVDLDKVLDGIPQHILWAVLQEYEADWPRHDLSMILVPIASSKSVMFPVHIGPWQAALCQGPEGFQFKDHTVFFVDDTLTSLSQAI